MESKIVKDLITFYQAYHHTDVIKLIEQNVELKKFKNAKRVLPARDHLADDPNWRWWDTTGLQYLKEDQVEVLWEWNKTKDEMNVLANGVLMTAPDMPIPYKHKEIPIAVINSTMRSRQIWGKGMCEWGSFGEPNSETLSVNANLPNDAENPLSL